MSVFHGDIVTDIKALIERLREHFKATLVERESLCFEAADALEELENKIDHARAEALDSVFYCDCVDKWHRPSEKVCPNVAKAELAEARRMRADEYDDRLLKCSATLAAERRAHEIELAEERRKIDAAKTAAGQILDSSLELAQEAADWKAKYEAAREVAIFYNSFNEYGDKRPEGQSAAEIDAEIEAKMKAGNLDETKS
jgi:hypothetical protein